jgi:branched-chain amino acid aminotransferase
MKLCYINDGFVAPSDALLPVTDFIIQRGVGLFEAVATHQRRALMLTPHLERLLEGAERAMIRPPFGLAAMRDIVREGIAQLNEELLVKVYLSGGDVFDPMLGFTASRFFVIYDALNLSPEELYGSGVRLHPANERRIEPSVKSIDYLKAYTLLPGDGSFEVLYCPDGEITESTHSSFFLFIDGTLVTAPLTRVLEGTVRQIVLNLAQRIGMSVEERCPLLSELPRASEAFITGSVKKILPVVQVGTQVIGNGRPGAQTKRLSDLYLERLVEWLE